MTKGQFHRLFPTCDVTRQWTAEVGQEVSKRTSHLAGLESHLRHLPGIAVFEDTYREPFQYLVLVGGRERHSIALDMLFSFSNLLFHSSSIGNKRDASETGCYPARSSACDRLCS